jgi:hypothetical protein
MKYVRVLLVTAVLAVASASPAIAADDGNGFYIRGGVAMGWVNSSLPSVSVTGNGGLEAGVGFRLAPALAIEGNFMFVTGGAISVDDVPTDESTLFYLGTVDAKLYPFMITASNSNVMFQPYVRVGIGGGGASAAGITSGAFVARFGGGLDWMINDSVGFYADASYYVSAGGSGIPAVGAPGLTTMTFGGILKF